VLVGFSPVGVRLNQIAHPDARLDGFFGAGEDAGGDAAEKCRTVGRALFDRRQLERQPEHRSDDLEPEAATRAATRDARRLGLDTEIAQKLE